MSATKHYKMRPSFISRYLTERQTQGAIILTDERPCIECGCLFIPSDERYKFCPTCNKSYYSSRLNQREIAA